jgi:hypothetical protein
MSSSGRRQSATCSPTNLRTRRSAVRRFGPQQRQVTTPKRSSLACPSGDWFCPIPAVGRRHPGSFSRVGTVVPDCVELSTLHQSRHLLLSPPSMRNSTIANRPKPTVVMQLSYLPNPNAAERINSASLSGAEITPRMSGLRLMLGTSRAKHPVPKTRRYPKVRSGVAMVAIVPCARSIEIAADASPMVNLVMNENVGQIADRISNQQNCYNRYIN